MSVRGYKISRVAASLALVLNVGGVVYGQEDHQARLDAQDERIRILEEELFGLVRQEEDPLADFFGNVDIHGFLAQGYMKSNENNFLTNSERGSWEFHEVGVNLSVDLNEKARTGIQLFSRDLGPAVDSEIIIDWAMFSYDWHDRLGFRFGKIKVPFGLYNETRDIDLLRNSILLPQSVYTETYRNAMAGLWGVGLHGGVGDGGLGHLEYQIQIGTTDQVSDGPILRALEDFFPVDADSVEMDYTWAGGLRWNTPLEGLDLSGTFASANFDSDGRLSQDLGGPLVQGTPANVDFSNTHFSVLSAEYTWEDLIMAAEYSRTTFKPDFDADLGGGVSAPISDTVSHHEGYYVSAAYRLSDWCEIGSYYSVYYPDSDDRDGSDQVALGNPDFKAWSKDLTLTTRLDLGDSWVFKLEGHRIDGVAGLLDAQNTSGYDQNWFLFVAKLAVSF